jgi:hypothetical protein
MLGLYTKVTVWRMMNSTVANDSPAGGAMMSGTVTYEGLNCALEDSKGTQLLFEQGLETTKLVDCIIRPQTLDIQERDELEVTFPRNHRYYGKRLRVVEVRNPLTHPGSNVGHLELRLQLIQRATRRNQ